MRFSSSVSLAVVFACLCLAQNGIPADGMGDIQIANALINFGINVTGYLETDGLIKKAGSCSYACGTLSRFFGSRVITQGNPAYVAFTGAFWSAQQAEVEPYCIFQPNVTTDVSVTVLLSRLTQCPFAVKSGGHAAFANASSIEGGITIDFSLMKSISISSDRKTASIQPGNIWHDVYANLNPQNVTVIGGRVADIGTGGLTTGGGISFFSNLYGWACDNVESYEVVTAQGTVIQANQETNSDLYWALRGGGNNFGIVTRFNYFLYPYTGMWGGTRAYTLDKFDAANQAFYDFGVNSPKDPNAALIFIVAGTAGQFFVAADMEYAKPIAAPPAIFSDFEAIAAVSDTTTTTSQIKLTEDFSAENPNGLRETYWAATFKMNTTISKYIVDTFSEEVTPLWNISGFLPACVQQVITKGVEQNMRKNGGNPLGISESEGPLILLNLAFMWNGAENDAAILRAAANILKKSYAKAKELRLYNDYIYMNYASQFQDVIGSYGAENKARLQSIAEKYDPAEVFQKLQPGYFKLDGPPNLENPS